MAGRNIEISFQLHRDFIRPKFDLLPEIAQAAQFAHKAHIDEHEFFERAGTSQEFVRTWISQELSITNAFSQLLLRIASMLSNIFLRVHFLEVALGEHGDPDAAQLSALPHPLLIERAAKTANIGLERVRTLEAT